MAPNSIESNTGRLSGVRSAGEDRVTSGKYKFEPGDVLYSKIRPNLNKVAQVDFQGLCSADVYALDIDDARAEPSFLARMLRSQAFLEYALSLSNRANIPKLNRTQLMGFEFELPPLDEQRRIAASLDQADTIRAKRRQVLAHLDDLTQSIFHAMFGDLTGPRWEQVPLGHVSPQIDSGSSPKCESRAAEEDEWGVLKLGAVTYGVFQPAENKAFLGEVSSMTDNEVGPGDVLMTRKNTPDLVGAVALVEDTRSGLLLPDLIFRIRLDLARVESHFFQAMMMSPQVRPAVRDLASGSAASMPNISKTRLRKLTITLPPLEKQQEFATHVEWVARQRDAVERALAADDELFASLQSRAFRGEL